MKKIFIAAFAAMFMFPVSAAASTQIPVLVSISPTSGDIDGGNVVTLNGSGFTESTVIRVGSTTVADTFVSSTQITIVMPARPAGRVNIAAFAGASGAVLTNAYEYIDIPDPTPPPAPQPAPQPSPEPTPEPVVQTPAPSAPQPAPQPVQSAPYVPQSIAPPSSEPVQQTAVPEPVISAVDSFPVYDFGNGLKVYTNESEMNVSLVNVNTVRFRFTLQRRIGGSWTTVDVAWRNREGSLTFYGVPLVEGSYRIVNAGNPIRWFRIDNVIL